MNALARENTQKIVPDKWLEPAGVAPGAILSSLVQRWQERSHLKYSQQGPCRVSQSGDIMTVPWVPSVSHASDKDRSTTDQINRNNCHTPASETTVHCAFFPLQNSLLVAHAYSFPFFQIFNFHPDSFSLQKLFLTCVLPISCLWHSKRQQCFKDHQDCLQVCLGRRLIKRKTFYV